MDVLLCLCALERKEELRKGAPFESETPHDYLRRINTGHPESSPGTPRIARASLNR